MVQRESPSEQVLARACFRVPEAQQEAFAEEYERRLLPRLRSHGLAPAREAGRTPAPGWFCRLLEAESTAQVATTSRALETDTQWHEALERAGKGTGVSVELCAGLSMYRAPACVGAAREAGLLRVFVVLVVTEP